MPELKIDLTTTEAINDEAKPPSPAWGTTSSLSRFSRADLWCAR
jgi:hypothetical protein